MLFNNLFRFATVKQSFSDVFLINCQCLYTYRQSLSTLIPRLYPFFRHTIMSVRSAVLNTLLTFLSMQDVEEWVDDRLFRLAFQNMIVEEKRVSILVIKKTPPTIRKFTNIFCRAFSNFPSNFGRPYYLMHPSIQQESHT